MRATYVVYATAFSLVVALSGCGRSVDVSGNQAATTLTSGSVADPVVQSAAAKLSGYTESYNKLIGTFGLTETATSYMDEKIAGKSPSDSVSITDGWIDQGVASLMKARAMAGSSAELNQAADRLQVALDKVLARLGPLKIYYDAKSYKEDVLARGKREDPLMRGEFTEALDALREFNGALKIERDKQSAGDLATLKAKGDMLGYDTKRALRQGEMLVDLFGSEADIKDPAVIAKSDALVRSLEATLSEQRQQFAAAKAKATPGEAPDYDYSSMADALTSMIGEYHDLKQTRSVDDLNAMVKEYNRAVESANGIHG